MKISIENSFLTILTDLLGILQPLEIRPFLSKKFSRFREGDIPLPVGATDANEVNETKRSIQPSGKKKRRQTKGSIKDRVAQISFHIVSALVEIAHPWNVIFTHLAKYCSTIRNHH